MPAAGPRMQGRKALLSTEIDPIQDTPRVARWTERMPRGEGTMTMYWFGHGMGWWGYLEMAIAMAVFWVLVIGCLAALVKYLFGRPSTHESFSAAEVLAARFAHGDITEVEYRDRLAVLRDAAGR